MLRRPGRRLQMMDLYYVERAVRVGHQDAHPSGQAQGNVALLPGIHNLQFIVVAAGGERLTGLGQTHVHDALSLPDILQELRRRQDTGRRVKG